jgi:hypothetical protein
LDVYHAKLYHFCRLKGILDWATSEMIASVVAKEQFSHSLGTSWTCAVI